MIYWSYHFTRYLYINSIFILSTKCGNARHGRMPYKGLGEISLSSVTVFMFNVILNSWKFLYILFANGKVFYVSQKMKRMFLQKSVLFLVVQLLFMGKDIAKLPFVVFLCFLVPKIKVQIDSINLSVASWILYTTIESRTNITFYLFKACLKSNFLNYPRCVFIFTQYISCEIFNDLFQTF